MKLFAIDPGNEESAFCVFDGEMVLESGILPNDDLLGEIELHQGIDYWLIEQIRGYGMAVGKEVFETCEWCGRFDMHIRHHHVVKAQFIPRREVKLELCGSSRAKDKNIRQALLDLIGPTGTKKKPGPTYGCKSHIWSALAVAATFYRKFEQEVA
jgi:hypothetical protein